MLACIFARGNLQHLTFCHSFGRMLTDGDIAIISVAAFSNAIPAVVRGTLCRDQTHMHRKGSGFEDYLAGVCREPKEELV